MEIRKLTIVIPFYNESKYLEEIVQRVIKTQLINEIKKEIILVNDASTDDSPALASNLCRNENNIEIRLINQPKNMGKGAAIHRGIENASGDYLIIQDADLEYNPEEYNILIQPILDDFADVVYGSRFMGGKPHRILFFWHSIGNKMLTSASNAMTNLNLTDMETCYKMWRSEIVKSVNLKEQRFGFEPEVTAKVSRIPKVRIYEVGISYYGRTYEEGKKINWKDGVRAIYCILKYNIWAKK